jgi:molybdate transport system permease protein
MIELLKNIEFAPFLISFKLAGITTLILFFISLPLLGIYHNQNQDLNQFLKQLLPSNSFTTICFRILYTLGIII